MSLSEFYICSYSSDHELLELTDYDCTSFITSVLSKAWHILGAQYILINRSIDFLVEQIRGDLRAEMSYLTLRLNSWHMRAFQGCFGVSFKEILNQYKVIIFSDYSASQVPSNPENPALIIRVFKQ
jgi:hypothetical protein